MAGYLPLLGKVSGWTLLIDLKRSLQMERRAQ
jgi:hypothetical protein